MYRLEKTCCFSGYRPEKIEDIKIDCDDIPNDMYLGLKEAIIRAYDAGYRMFISGMSRGFDIWAAETVLEIKKQIGNIELFCALPYDKQHIDWGINWKNRYSDIMLQADYIYSLRKEYEPGCFYERNKFLINASKRLICWYDGIAGGTEYTYKLAKRSGLEIDNIAFGQIKLY